MRSDFQFYQLFATEPRFLNIFTKLDPDAEYVFESRTFKEVSVTCDGLLEAKDPNLPAIIFEFQMQEDKTVYRRIFQEMAAYQRENRGRHVQGILVFHSRKLNKNPDPSWHPYSQTCAGNFKVLYLNEIFDDLKRRHPNAPLLAVLSPFVEQDPKAVWENVRNWISQLQQLPLSKAKRADIINVMLSWIEMILEDPKKKELINMLRAKTDFRDNFVTRAFKAEFEAIAFEKGKAQNLKDLLNRGIITQDVYDAEIKALKEKRA
jgi:predicted transposase YdaD